MTRLQKTMCCKCSNRQGLNSKEEADISCHNAPYTMTKTHQPRYSRMIGSSTALQDAEDTILQKLSQSFAHQIIESNKDIRNQWRGLQK